MPGSPKSAFHVRRQKRHTTMKRTKQQIAPANVVYVSLVPPDTASIEHIFASVAFGKIKPLRIPC